MERRLVQLVAGTNRDTRKCRVPLHVVAVDVHHDRNAHVPYDKRPNDDRRSDDGQPNVDQPEGAVQRHNLRITLGGMF